jgi:hypothetical protein
VTRRLPERMLLGSLAVPDIVLAYRVSDADPVTSGVARWTTLRMIPAAIFPRPVRGRRLVSHPE